VANRGDALFAKACTVIPGGVNSNTRGVLAGWHPRPPVIRSGLGCKVIDEDNREWLDCLLGLGVVFPGHREPSILEAVERHIRDCGSIFALPVKAEADAAERIVAAVPSVERVRFCNTGTEAVLFSVRLAKAWTGRSKIVKFHGMYHGFSDCITNHPELLVLPWNNLGALEETLEALKDDIAAVITEPVMCNAGCLLPRDGYLTAMAERVKAVGAVLIFDEVITGFRLGMAGAQGIFGVQPDLSVFGKALGGGYAVACLGGRADIMDQVACGRVPMLGTYAANGVAVAAAAAALELYSTSPRVEELLSQSDTLRRHLSAYLSSANVGGSVEGLGPVFQVSFRDLHGRKSPETFARWWAGMVRQGILLHPDPNEVIFLSLAHQLCDLERLQAACERAIDEL
jgi:glutamate-1-semialdehyde 2,1-aminomutase